jgi:hypothetical protein
LARLVAKDAFAMSWNANTEKLLCLVLLDDKYAPRLSDRAGQAFARAFIVEDRASGEIRMMFRFRYKDPDERSWYEARPDQKKGIEAVEFLRHAIQDVWVTATAMLGGRRLPDDAVKAFYPPDDGGDPGRTIIWLEMQDLVEIAEATE